MLIIQNVLVSDEIIENQFLCNLNACKGACCWEGDFGAPLEKEELAILDQIYPLVKPFLTKEGIKVIESEGAYKYWEEAEEYGTNLVNNGACVFITYDNNGIAKCGIEQAYQAQVIDFKKPISCHLYPIRVAKDEEKNFEALNYDEWEICTAACQAGKKAQLPVYQFVKEAIIRKYGVEFYEELDAAAEYLL
ncbi:MAG: DUF3109 family protein [Saprospiraceae bacterium]|nr:DUF3109 family protein [Saprospiraceae bacterium]